MSPGLEQVAEAGAALWSRGRMDGWAAPQNSLGVQDTPRLASETPHELRTGAEGDKERE